MSLSNPVSKLITFRRAGIQKKRKDAGETQGIVGGGEVGCAVLPKGLSVLVNLPSSLRSESYRGKASRGGYVTGETDIR